MWYSGGDEWGEIDLTTLKRAERVKGWMTQRPIHHSVIHPHLAPMRTYTPSIAVITSDSAGTHAPICGWGGGGERGVALALRLAVECSLRLLGGVL